MLRYLFNYFNHNVSHQVNKLGGSIVYFSSIISVPILQEALQGDQKGQLLTNAKLTSSVLKEQLRLLEIRLELQARRRRQSKFEQQLEQQCHLG
mmetsp:Transcript_1576/g.2318  ORF Transcript_1576/g.2318 Transcript_1576/m.2318 type:complete len:94 (+) Transcript_1576:1165-1446(+)